METTKIMRLHETASHQKLTRNPGLM